MSGDEMNVAVPTNSMPDSPSNKRYCPVCGDKTTRKHYGIYSCESCKLFFKRSANSGSKYTCSKNKKCMIDKDQRNDCKYCRYQKCLSVGMKYEEKPERSRKPKRSSNQEKKEVTEVNHGYRMRKRNKVKSYSEIEEDDEKDPAYRGDLGKEWEGMKRRKSHRPRESLKSYFSGSGSESNSEEEKQETDEESEQEEEGASAKKKNVVTKEFQLDGKTEFSASYQPKLKIDRVQDNEDSGIDDTTGEKKPATTAKKSRAKRRRRR